MASLVLEPISSDLGGFNKSSRDENHVINLHQQANDDSLTKDEERVLSVDHWIEVYRCMNPNLPVIQPDIDFLSRVTALVRKAFISMKETRGVIVDIVTLLDDKDSRKALFHLVLCFSRMDAFLTLLEQLRVSWLQDYPHIFDTMEPFVGRSKDLTDTQKASMKALVEGRKFYLKLEELGKGEKEAISSKIYSILLILKETLTLMGVQPRLPEGNKKPVESCSAELMHLVEDGAFQVANIIGKTDRVITKMLDSVYKEFAPDADEYKLALVSDKNRYEWSTKFSYDLSNSIECIYYDSGEIYKSRLRKVIDTVDPGCIFWYLNE